MGESLVSYFLSRGVVLHYIHIFRSKKALNFLPVKVLLKIIGIVVAILLSLQYCYSFFNILFRKCCSWYCNTFYQYC